MKHFVLSLVLLVLLVGCLSAPAPTPVPVLPTSTSPSSPVPPIATSTVSPTFTSSPIPPTATPTPLPGSLVLPIDTLAKTIPWLPIDETARPGVHYLAFNTLRPPFNSSLVRQAFVYAIDRQVIVEMAQKYKASNASPATTLTPAETLGRDLYNEVGITFDPEKAKALLTEAGYTDTAAFPTVTVVVNSYGDIAPGARFNMVSAMADMWKTNLGVTVQVEAMTPPGFGERLKSNPPEMYWLGWVADFNDPDNFLRGIFHSGSEYNYGKFENSEFDKLVDRASRSRNPAERQELYILAERLLCETEAAVIPLYHTR